MKIHSNDQVVVTSGKDKGKKAKVLRVNTKDNSIVVEGVNIVPRHMKRQGSTPGQKVTFEKPINVSNVMLLDPKSGEPTRVGYKVENGKKVRVAKKSNTVI